MPPQPSVLLFANGYMIYVRYVNDDHLPTRIIVLSDAPLSFIAIAPPAVIAFGYEAVQCRTPSNRNPNVAIRHSGDAPPCVVHQIDISSGRPSLDVRDSPSECCNRAD